MDNNLRKISQKIRKTILQTIYNAKHGHIGGSFSCTDILTVLYFGKILKFNPTKPNDPKRDRLILSKGHATAAMYSMLFHLKYITFKELRTYCKNNTRLATHTNNNVPGIEFDTGSLGHGLGIACGIAYSAKLNKDNFNIFSIMSDGEFYEGSVWEALIFASNLELHNLTIIIDRNKQIVMDFTEDKMKLDPLKDKIEKFGFNVFEIDGHSHDKMLKLFLQLKKNNKKLKPNVVIANTIKGKGVSFMEKNIKWHHSVPNEKEFQVAMKELL